MRNPVKLGLAAVMLFAYRRFVRPWHMRWGATDEEVNASLPGDERIADAESQITRAITIDASPDAVWAWLVQLGADRGGFYSYDRLENLFGLGIHSAKGIVPEWQSRAVGDLVYAEAKGTGGWYVTDVEPGRALVMKMGDVKRGRPVEIADGGPWEFLWSFVLRETPEGKTRLLVRERVKFGNAAMRLAMAPVGLVSFFMTQKTMRGIKQRAEASIRDAAAPTPRAEKAG